MKFKELKSLIGAVAAIALMASCGEKKKEAPATENETMATETVAASSSETSGISFDAEELNAFFTQYLALQEAFVASEPLKAGQVAREMAQLSLEGMPELSEAINALAESDHLGRQRALFFQLNKVMVPYLEAHLSSGEVYQQFCPMAFDFKGAFWLSDSEEILNPYFGEEMLTCGNVDEKL
jgi:hypothetical protein